MCDVYKYFFLNATTDNNWYKFNNFNIISSQSR